MSRQNPNVAPIPPIVEDPRATTTVLTALKEGVESLAGQRGGPLDRAVTFNDLIAMGLVTAAQARQILE